MAKRHRDMFADLAEVFVEGRPYRGRLDKVIQTVMEYDRVLVGLYSLLVAGVLALVILVQWSPWAGATLLLASISFLAGLVHTSLHVIMCRRMFMLADIVKSEAAAGSPLDEDEDSLGEFVDIDKLTRVFHSSQLRYLMAGVLCAIVAVGIDHWQYAWRALAGLAAATALFTLFGFIVRSIQHSAGEAEDHRE